MSIRYLLSIAASDTSGGAGINQDQRFAEIAGYWCVHALTGYTLQTSEGLLQIHPVTPPYLETQIRVLLASYPIAAIKIGALCDQSQLTTILTCLHDCKIPIVFDPVLAPSRGSAFLDAATIRASWERIIETVTVFTPNLQEWEAIRQLPFSVMDEDCTAIQQMLTPTAMAVLLKGGHGKASILFDYLITSTTIKHFSHQKENWCYQHGTGCALSTLLAAYLGLGYPLERATQEAISRVAAWYRQHPLNQRACKSLNK